MADKLQLRPSQEEVLKYKQGLLGISAVPGSGKTWTLSQLAVKLILTTDLEPDQEILIVTFTNSGADNFSSRIGEKLRQNGLMEGFGYRVRTLHGLANDILRERPDLVGLPNEFSMIDESETREIMKDLVSIALENHKEFLLDLLSSTLSDKKQISIIKKELPDLVEKLATNWIKTVKDKQISLHELETWLPDADVNPLMYICLNIYRGYQAALNYRGAIDFDDLIRYAYECLQRDPDLVRQLQHRWPYILEDEAQDSSKLQQQILTTLVGETGNWVRVGDPNQAIYESFTTADPNLLKTFVAREDVEALDLPVSGRSAQKIIDLANAMIEWVQNSHPNFTVRDALSEPFIQPTLPNDPQSNPESSPDSVEIIQTAMSAEQELGFLTRQVKIWLQENPESTVAVLTFVNERALTIIEHLKKQKIETSDALMKTPEPTRNSAGSIALILKSIYDPLNPVHLSTSFTVFFRHLKENPEKYKLVNETAQLLKDIDGTELFLYPESVIDFSEIFSPEILAEQIDMLESYRSAIQRWHQAAYLPMDQLVLVIAQDLVLDNGERAIVHKLSGLIKSLLENNPDWDSMRIMEELIGISKNKRDFATFSQKEDGFDPENYRGKVIVATVHKSKGLEWDKVFLTSANTYDYPSGEEKDVYTSEKWFIEGRRNLQAELFYDLEALRVQHSGGLMFQQYDKQNSRDDIVRDRLRLFYVGITRAKKSLTISWNTGKMNNLNASLPLKHLAGVISNER